MGLHYELVNNLVPTAHQLKNGQMGKSPETTEKLVTLQRPGRHPMLALEDRQQRRLLECQFDKKGDQSQAQA